LSPVGGIGETTGQWELNELDLSGNLYPKNSLRALINLARERKRYGISFRVPSRLPCNFALSKQLATSSDGQVWAGQRGWSNLEISEIDTIEQLLRRVNRFSKMIAYLEGIELMILQKS